MAKFKKLRIRPKEEPDELERLKMEVDCEMKGKCPEKMDTPPAKRSPGKGKKRGKDQLAAYLKRKAKNKGMLAEGQSDSEDI